MANIVKIEDIKNTTYKSINDMSISDKRANMKYWVKNYKNTIGGDRKYLISDALRCIEYSYIYETYLFEISCRNLFQIIKKDKPTDFMKGVFQPQIQYKSVFYKLYKSDKDRFEKAIFSKQPFRKLYEWFREEYEDNDLNEEKIYLEKNRSNQAYMRLFESVYTKYVDEERDIVIYEDSTAHGKVCLKVCFPGDFTHVTSETTKIKEINICGDVYKQWKQIRKTIKMLDTCLMKNNKNGERHSIVFSIKVFPLDKNANSLEYIRLVNYLSWIELGEIYIQN